MKAISWSRLFSSPALLLAISLPVVSAAEPEGAGGGLTLVRDGRPRAALVLSKESFGSAQEQAGRDHPMDGARRKARKPQRPAAVSAEREAAREIQLYCEKISGATLPIVQAGDELKGLQPIYLGAAADASLLDAVKTKGTDPGSFALVVTDAQASIRGLSPEATFYGACELLEQLGVRWFFPGELGTVIPKAQSLVLRPQQTIQVPSFPSRYLQGVGDDAWERHLRAGGPRFPSAHGVQLGVRPDALFQQHPEYFALRNGKRSTSQLCISNPEVLKLAVESTRQFFRDNPAADIIGMGANDGRGFCECDRVQGPRRRRLRPLRPLPSR